MFSYQIEAFTSTHRTLCQWCKPIATGRISLPRPCVYLETVLVQHNQYATLLPSGDLEADSFTFCGFMVALSNSCIQIMEVNLSKSLPCHLQKWLTSTVFQLDNQIRKHWKQMCILICAPTNQNGRLRLDQIWYGFCACRYDAWPPIIIWNMVCSYGKTTCLHFTCLQHKMIYESRLMQKL